MVNVKIKTLMMVLMCLCALSSARAEPALYKAIELPAINQLLVDGNIDIKIIQADSEKAEIFLRDTSNHEIKIGTEINKNGTRLVIKEQVANSANTIELRSMATVTLYLPRVDRIDLYNVSTFDMANFEQEKLHLWVRNQAKVSLKNLQITDFFVKLFNQSTLSAEHLNVGHGKIIQLNNSMADVSNSHIKTLITGAINSSYFTAINIQGHTLEATARNSANVTFNGESEFQSASLFTRHSAKLATYAVNFGHLKLLARNRSKVTLGKATSLDITARDSSRVTHFPSTIIKKVSDKGAQIDTVAEHQSVAIGSLNE